MSKTELARVLDRQQLDASSGPRGRLRVEVPGDWLRDGGDIALTLPTRLVCAHCDGGGCDACERSGALRAPGEPAARTLRLRLPEHATGVVVVRVVRPFGSAAPLEQLLVELCEGERPSPGVVRLERRRSALAPAEGGEAPAEFPVGFALAALALLALLVGLAMHQ